MEARDPPEVLRELAAHVLTAVGPNEARIKGGDIGKAKKHSYRNQNGKVIRWTFDGVVGVQGLHGDHLFNGMEVAGWFYQGKQLVLIEGQALPLMAGPTSHPRKHDNIELWKVNQSRFQATGQLPGEGGNRGGITTWRWAVKVAGRERERRGEY